MMKIWIKSSKLNISQRLTNKARLILKKGWWSDLEILEICRQVNREENTQRVFPKGIEAQNIEKSNHH